VKAGTSHKDTETGAARPSSVRGVNVNSHLQGSNPLSKIRLILVKALWYNRANTKGSWNHMPLQFKARKNLHIEVTDRQYEIIVGSLLGDAYIHPKGKIQFEHSDKAKEYLEWKFQELKGLRYNRVGSVERKVGNSLTRSYRFWTRQFFRPLRVMFYQDKKRLSLKILNALTPLALAVWFMDDGHFEKAKKRCIIATDGFSNEDRTMLQLFLKQRYGLDVVVRKSGKISFNQLNTERFFEIIKPYRLECMAYKFPNP